MKKKILINRHVINSNKKHDTNDPPVSVQTYKSNDYAHQVDISGPVKVVYSPDKPLSCGATVWIETDSAIVLRDNQGNEISRVC